MIRSQVGAWLSCLSICSLAFGGEGPATVLFDGRTLAGWDDPSKASAIWQVEDGAIVGRQNEARERSHYFHSARFRDYELTLSVKPDWGCDSGLFILDGAVQITIDYLDGGNVGCVHGPTFSSAPYVLHGPRSGPLTDLSAEDVYDGVEMDGLVGSATAAEFLGAWKADDWNELKVRCVGRPPRVTTWINGVEVCSVDFQTYRGRHRLARTGREPGLAGYVLGDFLEKFGDETRIGLQVHPGGRWAHPGGKVRFKDIRVVPIQIDD